MNTQASNSTVYRIDILVHLLHMKTQEQNKIAIRRAGDRFHSNLGWLDSYHTFSFADHYDPAFIGFESLRVINEDTVAPKMGFGEHGHADMEIISYVISGQLQHRDSMGNGRIIQAGDFQYISAGSGVRHSEFNPSETDLVHFLQIWITPKVKAAVPRYAEKSILEQRKSNGLTLIASGDGREGSIGIQQEAELHFGHLESGRSLVPATRSEKHWLHLISGEITLQGETLGAGDGAALHGSIGDIVAQQESEFILFAL